jgi:hypothetical protein
VKFLDETRTGEPRSRTERNLDGQDSSSKLMVAYNIGDLGHLKGEQYEKRGILTEICCQEEWIFYPLLAEVGKRPYQFSGTRLLIV